MMTSALRVSTTKVSINTPTIATTPDRGGPSGRPSLGVGVGGAHTGPRWRTGPAWRSWETGWFDGIAERTAHDGLRLKGVLEDHAEGGGDVPDAEQQDNW